jgi:cellulose synthase operon protein B
MIRILAPLSLLLLAGSTLAQEAPHFDMTPEANLVVPSATAPAEASADAQTPIIAAPDFRRYLLPTGDLRLAGETDRRTYQVFLTAAQAAAAAQLHVGFVNALVVSPESSRLRVQVNGTTVMQNPVNSSAAVAEAVVDVPAGVLIEGFNTVTVSADQRHRTDCSIGSTYELWTDVSASNTFLSFAGNRLGMLTGLNDIAAAGWNGQGVNTIRFIMPANSPIEQGTFLADLTQTLAMVTRSINSEITFATELPLGQEDGVLNVLVAPANELPDTVGSLKTEASSTTLAAFSADPSNALVLSGPDWSRVAETLEDLRLVATQYQQYPGALPPRADRAVAVPIFTGNGTVNFEQLGFNDLTFNGRRSRTSFDFALPADFYANKYGQAQITLSAAYSTEVQPGSQFDVYVNGEIASVTPILRTDDDLRDLPIKVPMSGFRPGVNTVEIVAALRTEADDICAPGTVTVGTDQRLLIANESSFSMPEFARISQVPNLAAFANTGFPYEDGSQAHLVVGENESLPAALTMLSRMTGQTDRKIGIRSVSLASPAPDQDAILVGAYGELPPDAIGRVGVLQPYANDDGALASETADIDSILQRWRSTGSSGDASLVGRFQHWVADLLNLGPNSLGMLPPADEPYAPRLTDRAVVLQTLQPEGGLWTMVTVPNADRLDDGIAAVTQASLWPRLGGRVSVVDADGETLEIVEPNRVSFFETSPWTFQNLRNVIANWLSSHVLAYGLGLCVVLIGLTIATTGVLRSVGRRA